MQLTPLDLEKHNILALAEQHQQMPLAEILSVATAVPPHRIEQSDVRQFAKALFGESIRKIDRLLPIFENTRITGRNLAQPLEWYGTPHTFPEANARYVQVALDISLRAAQDAIAQADLTPADIGMVLFVSSTGLATPSLDGAIIQALGMSPHTQRVPIWGLGCAGGVSGLARAAQLAQTVDAPVLLIATELCSLTFQHNDRSKANLIATSLFSDGAAAVVLQKSASPRVVTNGNGWQAAPQLEILNQHSTLFSESEDIMGWDIVTGGLKVRIAKSIPALVLREMAPLLQAACCDWGIDPSELKHFVAHPGGAKVLEAYSESLEKPAETFRHALDVLQQYGNMSSPTVLFVLEAYLQDVAPTGELGLMFALGPGFSAELILFRW